MSVIEEIAAERRRQIEVKGWTLEHDDGHDSGQMASAAACYALQSAGPYTPETAHVLRMHWPWGAEWWKDATPRRNLVKAAALIVAEIERLDRAAAQADAT